MSLSQIEVFCWERVCIYQLNLCQMICTNLSVEARSQRPNNPTRTICDVRSLLGQKWSDPKLQETLKSLHYRVHGENDKPVISVNIQEQERIFTPEEVAGILMAKLRDTAAARLGEDIKYAVVAVPTGFNSRQREAIKDAGATVGLHVLRTLNDSTAAVIAYELDRESEEQNVIVLDLGASKTDVTVFNIDEGYIEPIAAVSRPISGRIFNRRLVDLWVEKCPPNT